MRAAAECLADQSLCSGVLKFRIVGLNRRRIIQQMIVVACAGSEPGAQTPTRKPGDTDFEKLDT